MGRLEQALSDRSQRGTAIGADSLIARVHRELAGEVPVVVPMPPPAPRPRWAVASGVAAIVTVAAIGLPLWLLGGDPGGSNGAATTVAEGSPTETGLPGQGMPLVSGVGDGRTVRVTVSEVSGHPGDDLAGVLYEGEVTDLDRDALGGFWVVVSGDDFTTTEVVREPASEGMGRFPYVSDEALIVEPGTYTLVLWVDDALSPVSRWVPLNTDGMGLFGCHVVFEVGDDTQTDVAVSADLRPDGWNIDCATGVAIPGTNSADPVTPTNDWMGAIGDVAVAPDGTVYGSAPLGIASLDTTGDWTLLNIDALPEGQGLEGAWPGRTIDHVAVGADGTLWVAGVATSTVEDEEFGGQIDGWSGVARHLGFVARRDCTGGQCSWIVFTSDETPGLAWSVGDLVVAPDGSVYAAGSSEPVLLVFDGAQWRSHSVPGFTNNVSPWSGSLAVAADGTVWAGTNDPGLGRGLYAFDGESFIHYTSQDGLPSDNVFQVSAGSDGLLWVATDALYGDPDTAAPDAAGGIASFDGVAWTTYTMADGLLTNDAIVAAGDDGTVWAIHSEIRPHGVSHFDGGSWTAQETETRFGGFRSAVAPDGSLWTTSQGALIHYDGETATVYPSPFA